MGRRTQVRAGRWVGREDIGVATRSLGGTCPRERGVTSTQRTGPRGAGGGSVCASPRRPADPKRAVGMCTWRTAQSMLIQKRARPHARGEASAGLFADTFGCRPVRHGWTACVASRVTQVAREAPSAHPARNQTKTIRPPRTVFSPSLTPPAWLDHPANSASAPTSRGGVLVGMAVGVLEPDAGPPGPARRIRTRGARRGAV